VISLDHVNFGYDGASTLCDLTVQLAPGSFHFLTGPSGSGKTTLLKLLYIEHRPVSGRIELFGTDPARLNDCGLIRAAKVAVEARVLRLAEGRLMQGAVAL